MGEESLASFEGPVPEAVKAQRAKKERARKGVTASEEPVITTTEGPVQTLEIPPSIVKEVIVPTSQVKEANIKVTIENEDFSYDFMVYDHCVMKFLVVLALDPDEFSVKVKHNTYFKLSFLGKEFPSALCMGDPGELFGKTILVFLIKLEEDNAETSDS